MINEEGAALIKSYEALKLTAYLCQAKKPTIGWGHTKRVSLGDSITLEQAEQFFVEDIAWAEACVAKTIKMPMTENERAAMVSLCFNIGTVFSSSTVARKFNAGDKAGAAKAFAMWNLVTVDGKKSVSSGLVARRAREAELFRKPPAELKSLTRSRIMRGSTVAGVATAVGAAMQQIEPLMPLLSTFLQLAPWLIAMIVTVIVLTAVGYVVYARWDDRRKGIH